MKLKVVGMRIAELKIAELRIAELRIVERAERKKTVGSAETAETVETAGIAGMKKAAMKMRIEKMNFKDWPNSGTF